MRARGTDRCFKAPERDSGAYFAMDASVRGELRGYGRWVGVGELWKTLLGCFHKRANFLAFLGSPEKLS